MKLEEILSQMSPRDARMHLAKMQAQLMAMEPPSEEVVKREDVANEFYDAIGTMPEERFAVIFMNQSNVRIGPLLVFDGGSVTRTVIYPRVLFKEAVLRDASRIILCHNHPGGNPEPSNQDRDLTDTVGRIGRSLEVELTDHIIVTPKKGVWISLAQRGWV